MRPSVWTTYAFFPPQPAATSATATMSKRPRMSSLSAFPRRQITRLRVLEEVRIARVLLHQPVHERIAVLRRPELRDVDELRPRLLRDCIDAAHAQHVERVDCPSVQPLVHLGDHFLLSVRMRLVGIDLAVQGCMRIG